MLENSFATNVYTHLYIPLTCSYIPGICLRSRDGAVVRALKNTKTHHDPPKTTNTHQNPPRTTKTHHGPPTPTNIHQNPPRPTKTHQNPPGPTRTHQDLPWPTNTHQDPPWPTKNRQPSIKIMLHLMWFICSWTSKKSMLISCPFAVVIVKDFFLVQTVEAVMRNIDVKDDLRIPRSIHFLLKRQMRAHKE